jgi:hypothetical protein
MDAQLANAFFSQLVKSSSSRPTPCSAEEILHFLRDEASSVNFGIQFERPALVFFSLERPHESMSHKDILCYTLPREACWPSRDLGEPLSRSARFRPAAWTFENLSPPGRLPLTNCSSFPPSTNIGQLQRS